MTAIQIMAISRVLPLATNKYMKDIRGKNLKVMHTQKQYHNTKTVKGTPFDDKRHIITEIITNGIKSKDKHYSKMSRFEECYN